MKKLIVRIAEGLGNQMFMYSHSYSLSKKLNYTLFLDNTSGYFKNKNQEKLENDLKTLVIHTIWKMKKSKSILIW